MKRQTHKFQSLLNKAYKKETRPTRLGAKHNEATSTDVQDKWMKNLISQVPHEAGCQMCWQKTNKLTSSEAEQIQLKVSATLAVKGAAVLAFVIPHQFISGLCDQMRAHVTEGAISISLIKVRSRPRSSSQMVRPLNLLQIFLSHGSIFKELLQTNYFCITVVQECDTGNIACQNIVAVGAGFCDNTKAAVIRLGLMEMIVFAKFFCQGEVSSCTFLESCGVADLVTSCYGGRNRKVAQAFVKMSKSIAELEAEMLNVQKLQGPQTSTAWEYQVGRCCFNADRSSEGTLIKSVLSCYLNIQVKKRH
uniref:glycerol-3-phosphate dehydrogenase (NAD(+)) n=1 Tax=Mola mola TaxID=94237 RepID=A0A3Q3VMD6_MOLML